MSNYHVRGAAANFNRIFFSFDLTPEIEVPANCRHISSHCTISQDNTRPCCNPFRSSSFARSRILSTYAKVSSQINFLYFESDSLLSYFIVLWYLIPESSFFPMLPLRIENREKSVRVYVQKFFFSHRRKSAR